MRIIIGLITTLILVAAAGWFYFDSDPGGPTPSTGVEVPIFLGKPAIPKPLSEALTAPLVQHPFLAPSGYNSMHNDAAQSDSYRWSGPLGNKMHVSTRQFHRITGSCVAQTFNSAGRLLGTCVSPFGVTLVARDPGTLDVLDSQIITRWLPIGQRFSGGVYFHLDNKDRVLLATNDLAIQLWALKENDGNLRWQLDEEIAIADTLNSVRHEKHLIIDVMPDRYGNYWFITRDGLIGVIDRTGKNGQAIALGQESNSEGIDNALAVGEHGVFVVSNHALYSFKRSDTGNVITQWRELYDRSSGPKEGTMGYGSGTTPTLMGKDYVAISDNADGQINVMVYAQQAREGSQAICAQPIFPKDRGTTENSLSAAGNSLIAENNFAYSGPKNIPNSETGIARINVLGSEEGCELAWENLGITSPSAVPKVSLANGLIYIYTRDEGNPQGLHAWYFTAVDFETGELVYCKRP